MWHKSAFPFAECSYFYERAPCFGDILACLNDKSKDVIANCLLENVNCN